MESVREYLLTEKKLPDIVVDMTVSSLQRHHDILCELKLWIESRKYETSKPVTVEGYTASDIAELAPFLDGVGVFSFLVSLRERPDEAKKYIAEGFPQK